MLRSSLFLLIVSSLFSPAVSAGPQPKHASAEEAQKAPRWPTSLILENKQCEGALDEDGFYSYLDTINGLNSYMHQHLRQVDLNGDGSCEFIAYQTMDCGVGGCAQASITLYDGKVLFLGGQPEYWHFHSAADGWLQLSTTSNAGAAVSVQRLYKFIDGHYQQVRQDRYVQNDDNQFEYDGTTLATR